MTVLKDNANIIEDNLRALETVLNSQNHSYLARKNKAPPKKPHKQTEKTKTNQPKWAPQPATPLPPNPQSSEDFQDKKWTRRLLLGSVMGKNKVHFQASLQVSWKLSLRPSTTLKYPFGRWTEGSLLQGRAWQKSITCRFPVPVLMK